MSQDPVPEIPVPEVLAYVEHDGHRLIVVWFPPSWLIGDDDAYELMPDCPYAWRAKAVDRSSECSR